MITLQEPYWPKCKLTTILTDPPRHELTLPDGQILTLRTSDFFDVPKFTIAFVDRVGEFPPLPEKKPGPYLRDLFRHWLSTRATVAVPEEEASDRGALLGDIRLALSACPETDDPRDLDRGALYTRPDGSVWANARILLERVRRSCPVKFPPTEFYLALGSLGAANLGVQREGGWRGRVWSVPPALLPETLALPEAGVTAPPVTANGAVTPGIFDDL